MGTNRLEELFRDPTLERVQEDYYLVRMDCISYAVTRDCAERVVSALSGAAEPTMIRLQLTTGAVVYVRAKDVYAVQECTRAHRAGDRRLWKMLDDEENGDEELVP